MPSALAEKIAAEMLLPCAAKITHAIGTAQMLNALAPSIAAPLCAISALIGVKSNRAMHKPAQMLKIFSLFALFKPAPKASANAAITTTAQRCNSCFPLSLRELRKRDKTAFKMCEKSR